MKKSPGSLDTEEHNKNYRKTHSSISKMCSEVGKNKNSSANTELDSRETLHGCRLKPHLGRQNNKLGFPPPSCDVERECIVSAEPVLKGLNASPVSSPTLCRTKANKILQFIGDNSDAEVEDDLITSSQGCENSERKGYVIS
jgi:hypothetical protein